MADRYQGKRLNSPNDLAIRSDGSVYFTDPPLGISPSQEELGFNGLFCLSPQRELMLLASDFDGPSPNGLAFSPDETKLYVADPNRGNVLVYNVQPDGSLEGGEVFARVSVDGMKVDSKGRLYMASPAGITVVDADGETIGVIAFPEQPSNCCFGGADNRTLFVTARTSLYRVRLCESEITVDYKRSLTLTWGSVSGRMYTVYRSSDMIAWELAADDVASAAGNATMWTDATKPLLSLSVRRRYYKVCERE